MMRVLYFILITAIAGCSVKKVFIRPDQNITYQKLLQGNVKWQENIRHLQGDVRITVDTPQYSGNFNAEVFLSANDSLLVSVSGPLGMNVGKVFLAPKRFIFYNQIMNQFYAGPVARFSDNNFMQFPLKIHQLRDIFAARDVFNVLKREDFEILEDSYYIEASNGHMHYKIWFEPEYRLIQKIEYYDQERLLYYKEYNQIKIINGVPFPMAINFVRPSEKEGLAIFFNNIKINELIEPGFFEIKISDQAKQIDLSLEN